MEEWGISCENVDSGYLVRAGFGCWEIDAPLNSSELLSLAGIKQPGNWKHSFVTCRWAALRMSPEVFQNLWRCDTEGRGQWAWWGGLGLGLVVFSSLNDSILWPVVDATHKYCHKMSNSLGGTSWSHLVKPPSQVSCGIMWRAGWLSNSDSWILWVGRAWFGIVGCSGWDAQADSKSTARWAGVPQCPPAWHRRVWARGLKVCCAALTDAIHNVK